MRSELFGLLALAAASAPMTSHVAAAAVACSDPAVYAAIAALPSERVVFLSGASAPQAYLTALIGGLYQGANSGQIDLASAADNDWCTYYDRPAAGATAGALYRAFFGRLSSSARGFANQFVLFVDRAKGGSVFGIDPVARATPIAWLNPTAAHCSPAVGTGTIANPVLCDATGDDAGGNGRVPDFGVSDLAPYMFKDPLNVEFGAAQLSPAELGRFGSSITPINELMMGYAITRRVTIDNPPGIGNIVTVDLVPPTYRVTKARYAAMLSGQVREWPSQGLTQPPAGPQVVVCRRQAGSGTQAAFNWYFNNFPCTVSNMTGRTGAFAPATQSSSDGYNDEDGDGSPDFCWDGTQVVGCSSLPDPINGPGSQATPYVIELVVGYTVIENASSGIVRDCLSKAANGGVHLYQDARGKWFRVDFRAGGYGAIGVLSLDNLDSAQFCTSGGIEDVNAGWTFRHEDGEGETFNAGGRNGAGPDGCVSSPPIYQTVAGSSGAIPRKGNHLCGGYEFTVELTMQYRDPAAPGAVQPLNGSKRAFVDDFMSRAGGPANNGAEWVAAIPRPLFGRVPTVDGNVAAWARGNACGPIVAGDFLPYVNRCPAPNRGF
jgi:hypothetical protein